MVFESRTDLNPSHSSWIWSYHDESSEVTESDCRDHLTIQLNFKRIVHPQNYNYCSSFTYCNVIAILYYFHSFVKEGMLGRMAELLFSTKKKKLKNKIKKSNYFIFTFFYIYFFYLNTMQNKIQYKNKVKNE